MIDPEMVNKLRAKQEEIAQVLVGGYYKVFIELQAKLFNEYTSHGFTREEALEIILVMIQHNKWNLEPNFCKGVSNDDDEESQTQF